MNNIMEESEIKEILIKHEKWLRDEPDGRCADFSGADLSFMNFHGKNLLGANFEGANLESVNFFNANIRSANFRGANLYYANLSFANLCCVDLSEAILCYANLCCADLYDADLCNADVRNANFFDVDLSKTKNIPYIPLGLPDGELIGWKKVYNFIIKLKILEDSKRSRATGFKCRCDKALVVDIQNKDGTQANVSSVTNFRVKETTYTVGEIVHADSWNENRWEECTHGIHFFIDRNLAVNY